MTEFKFGDKVRVRDSDDEEWQSATYVFFEKHGVWSHRVLFDSPTSMGYYEVCELVEPAPEQLIPKFKVGDTVNLSGWASTRTISKIHIAYTFIDGSGLFKEEQLELAPEKIKVGDKVSHLEYTSLRDGAVLARFVDANNNDCVVVQWRTLSYAIIELVNKLELA